ncbi:MAG: SDR family NAD(P)-dependent oxidoreductase [Salinivirgaceae bacterium]|jgi:short-subunit dehydrogenase|nr:SDR family NAD(P)-dependent oxidoreductase [Salinivirgaceae bacterium]
MISFKNKNVLLTGATSGIGKCLLKDLLEEGANVSFCGRSAQKMDNLHKEIASIASGEVYSEVFDMADVENLYSYIKNTFEQFKTIDLLINCAGLNSAKDDVLDLKHSDLDYMMAINFKAPLILMQEVGKQMKKDKQGTIVNILSSVCLFNNERMASYTASKVAMDAASKIMNKEMREHNVRVVGVYPGGVDTSFRTMDRPDYLPVQEVSDIIMANLKAAKTAALDEIVFRPMVEKNFN